MSDSGRRIRYGMVGGGPGAFIGAVHRMAAALDGEWELVAGAFSSQPERSREQGRVLGLDPGRVYDSWREMAAAEASRPGGGRIEAVAVVTPNHLHHPVAATFLNAGFHVVCDKPMTTTVAAAEELCRTVERTGKIFALTHNYTGYPLIAEAREIVRSGRLGRVRKVVARYLQGWLGERLEATGHRQAEWRQDPAQAGPSSAVGDIGTHVDNLVRHLTGLETAEVFADFTTFVPGRELEDDATVLVRFAGGARGVYAISQVATGEENGLALRIYGDRAGLVWRQEEPNHLEILPADGPRRRLTRGGAGLGGAAARATRLPPGHPEGFIEAFANLYRSVGRAIRDGVGGGGWGDRGGAGAGEVAGEGGARGRVVGEDGSGRGFPDHTEGLAGVRFVECAVKSAAVGGWVALAAGSGAAAGAGDRDVAVTSPNPVALATEAGR